MGKKDGRTATLMIPITIGIINVPTYVLAPPWSTPWRMPWPSIERSLVRN
ncbi:hypothetical protein P0D73_45345 [Paraburkholderia sp. RL18-101-BIB-B]